MYRGNKRVRHILHMQMFRLLAGEKQFFSISLYCKINLKNYEKIWTKCILYKEVKRVRAIMRAQLF